MYVSGRRGEQGSAGCGQGVKRGHGARKESGRQEEGQLLWASHLQEQLLCRQDLRLLADLGQI